MKPQKLRALVATLLRHVQTNKRFALIFVASAIRFFTGSEKIVDSTGRVDKFKKKYGMK